MGIEDGEQIGPLELAQFLLDLGLGPHRAQLRHIVVDPFEISHAIERRQQHQRRMAPHRRLGEQRPHAGGAVRLALQEGKLAGGDTVPLERDAEVCPRFWKTRCLASPFFECSRRLLVEQVVDAPEGERREGDGLAGSQRLDPVVGLRLEVRRVGGGKGREEHPKPGGEDCVELTEAERTAGREQLLERFARALMLRERLLQPRRVGQPRFGHQRLEGQLGPHGRNLNVEQQVFERGHPPVLRRGFEQEHDTGDADRLTHEGADGPVGTDRSLRCVEQVTGLRTRPRGVEGDETGGGRRGCRTRCRCNRRGGRGPVTRQRSGDRRSGALRLAADLEQGPAR